MPVTLNGTNGLTFNDGSSQATAATGFGFKNRIINGDMRIWQRGTSFSSPAFGAYTADRFYNPSGATTSISRSTDVPAGFQFSASISGNSGGSNGWAQRIESFNCVDLAGQSVTVSFWAKNSSGADNLQVVLFNATAQDNFGGLSSIGSTTVSASPSSSWTYYTATFNSMPSGVANGMVVQVVRGQTAASTTLITGVQLEKGSTATSFDYRPYGTELALCQRYLPAFNSTGTVSVLGGGYAAATNSVNMTIPFLVQARVPPTGVTVSSASHIQWASGGTAAATVASFNAASTTSGTLVLTVTAVSGQGGVAYFNTTSGQILFTGCEL